MYRLHLGPGLGAAITLVCAGLFAGIAAAVVTGGPILSLDIGIGRWLQSHRVPALTQGMLLISFLHSTLAVACYAGVAGLLALHRRLWWPAAMLGASVGGVLALNAMVKLAFHRPRPDFDPVALLPTYSFPSGHVAASTVMYLLVMTWVFGRTRARGVRLAAVSVAALAVALVALSRMYLGVHYLSDVLAALAEGAGWTALCAGALTVLHRRAGAAATPSGGQAAPGNR